eukprot:TRINITY_DN11671_c0_g1_i3.p1 TRINITY_DN11671_c0_g1~~TRINITY_DN11671_c0_g1_i3.p1  ORF type:complete len:416 (+),score=150.54 TRINITY_DN11671_c0_g1_i3:117-1250(+)
MADPPNAKRAKIAEKQAKKRAIALKRKEKDKKRQEQKEQKKKEEGHTEKEKSGTSGLPRNKLQSKSPLHSIEGRKDYIQLKKKRQAQKKKGKRTRESEEDGGVGDDGGAAAEEERGSTSRAEAEKPKKVQLTQDNMREADSTMVAADDIEVAEDTQADELAWHFSDITRMPKIVVTTTPFPTPAAKNFIKDMLDVFTGAEYRARSNYHIKEMVEYCKHREYTHLVVVGEAKKQLQSITVICLPEGPTAFFKLTSVRLRKTIPKHGKPTEHLPELVLNNFSTRLGHTIGRLFATLFPKMAEFQGRRVVTFHNQRDFIFFRHHRYIFSESGKKARLQELGPRFTLKLQWLQHGTFDTEQGEYEWKHKKELDTSRRRFFL